MRAADGGLSNRRVWARLGEPLGADHAVTPVVAVPDGLGLDAEGAVWVADAVQHCVLRVAEGGRVIERIPTGELGVYACMFGGDDGCTLYLCAAPSFLESERAHTLEAKLLSTRVRVPHAGWP
ncbi:MAG: SMP-30/gluconolactonase/LRE family protein [Panacagrimonas sp.]